MSDSSWYPSKNGLRYIVQRCTYSNFAGAWYEFAREGGRVMRFWRFKSAQAYAAMLNAATWPRSKS